LYYPQAIFVVGDCALPLETGEAAKGKDYDSEALLKFLYLGKVTEKYNYLNAHRIPGKASRKFDVVSCQFAIHYFCKSKDRLEGFLRNVSFNLKPNGKFITTFMDGVKVHQLIQKEGFAKGVKDGNVVWCIQKQYKSFNKANAYGRLIDVYLENTNQFILEYLVHFDVLKEKAKEYHLEVVEDGFFGDMFQMLKQKMIENDPNRNRFIDNDLKALDKDPVQTQFSFLNRWVIFRKMEEREIVA
jgi:SAM-dependent methyltransferase